MGRPLPIMANSSSNVAPVAPRLPPGVSKLPVIPTMRSQMRLFWTELHACSMASMYWMPPLP